MKQICRMTTAELHAIVSYGTDATEDQIDEAYDELDRREDDARFQDHTESDYYAAQSERLEMFMNEY